MSAIRYLLPDHWIRYSPDEVFQALAEAKAAVLALTTTPFQRSWVEKLQEVQLKMEVAGTSRIEGAEFTERELDLALRSSETAEQALTRSQRQARSAVATYRWIGELPLDRPVSVDLIREIHRRIVTGCDDDRCAPGKLRGADHNVTFGIPVHRGCDGGDPCEEAMERLVTAMHRELRAHDPLMQALAAHYHFAAMHPFEDGNGRTARAMEALLLQRSGLRDNAFIAMSNYYYENKAEYLSTLAAVRAEGHDLTKFLVFGLKGIALQCQRLFAQIRHEMRKTLFRDTMYRLFERLKSKRKRFMGQRQIQILNVMLEVETIAIRDLWVRVSPTYDKLNAKGNAYGRDLVGLLSLKAIAITHRPDSSIVSIRLEWPTEITETEFFKRLEQLPRGKTLAFLRGTPS